MSWPTILGTLTLAFIVWLSVQLVNKMQMRRRMPPGSRLPPMPAKSSLWGHVELFRYDFHRKAALKWAKEHGPVFRLKVYFSDIVVLNNFEAIKTFCSAKEILDRSNSFAPTREYYIGVGSLNGDAWTSNRKFCLSMLRDVGFAKTAMEDRMMEEFHNLAEEMGKKNTEPVNIQEFLIPCAFNNIASFFYGALPRDHPSRLELHRVMMQLKGALTSGPLFDFMPWKLRRLLSNLPSTRNGRMDVAQVQLEEFTRRQIDAYNGENDVNNSTGFIRRYLEKIEERKEDPNPMFTYRYLVGNINAFLLGGTFSTAITMNTHLVNFAKHPHTIQARVQQEIDDVIGRERQPTWEDRKKMPFTLACVWEMDRWKTAAALGIPRECAKDVVIDGFFIPKGTVVLPNIWAVHQDPALWKEPEKFMPGRFLNDDGSIISHKPECLIPFCLGRRACPGDTFASMEIFLMITCLLQKYKILPHQPINLDLDSHDTLFYHVQQIKLRFFRR